MGIGGKAVKVPRGFWLAAGVSLFWNSYGGYDYVMSETRNAAYLAQVPPAAVAQLVALPWWNVALWALGVWGSVAGSLLLLARRRSAVAAFAVSFVAALASFAAEFARGSGQGVAMPAVVLVAIAAQGWGARVSASKGWLV